MAYRTVLVGTDGSETATLALRTATVLAKRYGSEVLIVCAHGEGLDDATAREVLRYARQDVRKEGLQTRTVMRQGDPSEVILGAADERGAELIVTGNVGMGKARRVRLGGVPDRIAHAAPCDTLIVHTSKRAAQHAEALGRYEKVLIATDGSATASEAARKGFELAEILGASVTLVHVGDPLIGAIVLDETAKGRPGTAEVRPRTVEGDPADQILRIAAEEEVDLVVVGNKGMAGARRYLLAAVPNQVAHESPTDVLIAKTVGRSIGDIAAGHGALVDVQGRRVAVFKAEDGSLTALNPRCTHMGCTVDWNEAERTWDCPCHGSRYDLEGEVLRGPAKRPLERVELDRP